MSPTTTSPRDRLHQDRTHQDRTHQDRPHQDRPHQVLVPTVIEEGNRGDHRLRLHSRSSLRERIVFLGHEVDDQVANLIISQMLFLEAQNSERDIYLYINSPGGVALHGDGDLRRHTARRARRVDHLRRDGHTHCRHDPLGRAHQEALRRCAHAQIMIHQGSAPACWRTVETWRSSCARCCRSPAACPRSSPTTPAVRSSRSPARTSTATTT